MQAGLWLRRALFAATLISMTCAGVAQGPPGHDRDNPPPGHGGTPPGQAKKYDRGDHVPPGQAKKYGDSDRGMPPGQAKKYFRDADRDRFYAHYRGDADRWRDRRRPVFVTGEYVAREYVVQPVPRGYWVGVVAAPPPGYQYGYCGGYVVAWNPATRMIADVLDLVVTARGR
ncbi:MAG TPA: hypothetical protein VKT75_18770 [Acidobacteriaceae bacterium]|nr:hypothetical protein [Acidobacteriaceae bacterium]